MVSTTVLLHSNLLSLYEKNKNIAPDNKILLTTLSLVENKNKIIIIIQITTTKKRI